QDQAASIEEVGAAVRQMDEMTQHNAALVEQTNASIERTEEQATELDQIVDIFRLEDGGAAPVRAASEKRPAGGIMALKEKVQSAAKTYLSRGNTAIDKEWAEF